MYAFCDGAKGLDDAEDVAAVRALLHSKLGNRCTYIERNENVGLARNIIEGVSLMCERHGVAVVLEDDIVVAPGFLRFMNAALEKYRGDFRVMQVAGCSYDLDAARPAPYFLPIAASWGWATWDRAWRHFDSGAPGWNELLHDARLRHQFDVQGTFGFSLMMFGYYTGRNNSWLVRWNWAVFRLGGSVLFPGLSLVTNIGHDGGGTHGRGLLRSFSIRASESAPIEEMCADMPTSSEVTDDSRKRLRAQMKTRNGGVLIRTWDRIRTIKLALQLRWKGH